VYKTIYTITKKNYFVLECEGIYKAAT